MFSQLFVNGLIAGSIYRGAEGTGSPQNCSPWLSAQNGQSSVCRSLLGTSRRGSNQGDFSLELGDRAAFSAASKSGAIFVTSPFLSTPACLGQPEAMRAPSSFLKSRRLKGRG